MSLHALIVLAAEEAGEEKSKTFFYVAGGVLAAWAILLGVLGTVRHGDFPGDGQARAIAGVSALLVAVALVAAVVTG